MIELAKDCKLVKVGYENNGHDCWGNLEYNEYLYVLIDGKVHRLSDDWYVVHDGKDVSEILSEYLLNSRKEREEHFAKTGFNTPAEYSAYLKGKNERS